VAPEDLESLGAIERLIRKRIERVLVPGFGPSAGTVATLMGGERRRAPRREAKHQPPPADPIFSKPYEPSQAQPPAAHKVEEPRSKRKRPQVAALLGGIKRA
jgi:hypothetical protein